MIRDSVDIDVLRDSLADIQYEVNEMLKMCDIVDFAENPSSIQCEHIEIGEIFTPVEISPDLEEEIVQSMNSGMSTISLLIDSIKGRLKDG